MKSFKAYTRQAAEVAANQEKGRCDGVGSETMGDTGATNEERATQTAEELTKKIASAYHGKSNADMLRAILAEAEKSKRAGTLSNEEIETFYQNFAPMLNGFQKKQLRAVVERLKEIE